MLKYYQKSCKKSKSSTDFIFLYVKKNIFVFCVLVLSSDIVLRGKEESLMNHVLLVGRLTKDPELKPADGKSSCQITLAVKRGYKNSSGIYETDFIRCTVWNIIAEKVCEFCKKGDLISVKARVQNNNYIDKDDNKIYTYEFIADQISFMQSQKEHNLDEKSSKSDKKEEEADEEFLNAE